MGRARTLSDAEVDELKTLQVDIVKSLSCGATEDGFPCRTDRLHAVKLMRRYVEIHGYPTEDLELPRKKRHADLKDLPLHKGGRFPFGDKNYRKQQNHS